MNLQAPLCVLVLHPSEKVRANLRAILEAEGNTVHEAANVNELVQVFKAEPVNVVLALDDLPNGTVMQAHELYGPGGRVIPLCVMDPSRLLESIQALSKTMPPPTYN